MGKNFCTISPSKGKKTWDSLRKNFDYKTSKAIFLRGLNPQFQRDYADSLKLDDEKVPTFESLMKNPFIRDFIGENKMIESLNKGYAPIEDTVINYESAIDEAARFNENHDWSDRLVAVVTHAKDGKIKVDIRHKNDENVATFKNQRGTLQLNKRLTEIFGEMGINIGMLSEEEARAGIIGETDFNTAKNIMSGFATMIRIANNHKGTMALPEEAAHVIIGLFMDSPLVSRSFEALRKNPELVEKILGAKMGAYREKYNNNEDRLIEEALGHVLRDKLLNLNQIEAKPVSLFQRMVEFIKSKFKNFLINQADDIDSYIAQVDSNMSKLASDILFNSVRKSNSEIKNARRQVKLNALESQIERNIAILKKAERIELKRYKLYGDKDSKKEANQLIQGIEQFANEEADTYRGMYLYALNATRQLNDLYAHFEEMDAMKTSEKWKFLRDVNNYIKSYSGFISDLYEAMAQDTAMNDDVFLQEQEGADENESKNLRDILRDLNDASKLLTKQFSLIAIPAFAKFLEPYLGKTVRITVGKYAGQEMSVEDLIKRAPYDITLLDRFLDSAAESSDVILQGIDIHVKKTKERARQQTIKDTQTKIYKLANMARDFGIDDFEWMFEHFEDGSKSGNLLTSIHWGKFNREKDRFYAYLKEKYGEICTTQEAADAKRKERRAWRAEHCQTLFDDMPNRKKYRNEEYFNLQSNQKTLMDAYLNLKSEFDMRYPAPRVVPYRAIQIRRSGTLRAIDALKNPSNIIENIKSAIAEKIFERPDDDQIFGDISTKSLTDFNGREFMRLPIMFTAALENPNEVSTDVFDALINYAYATNQYLAMSSTLDTLEVGRELLREREVTQTKRNKEVTETINGLGMHFNKRVIKGNSNIIDRIDDFYESQIYERHFKDAGGFTLFGKNISNNKLVTLWIQMSSTAMLGFNGLSSLANLGNGISMMNIEAAAGQWFTAGNLAKADKDYVEMIWGKITDIGNAQKSNKLDLLFEFFNIKQDYENRIKDPRLVGLVRRIFGETSAMIFQEAGDHWLYTRTALAMMNKTKVLKDGKEMSLYDAIEYESIPGNDTAKRVNKSLFKDGNITNLDGSKFDYILFGQKIARINQKLFGIYNQDDANAANQIALGKIIMQFKKWMKPMMNNRFQKLQKDIILETDIEGYYRTTGRIISELIRGEKQLFALDSQLTDEEKFNIKRALLEVVQFMAVYAIANWIDWPDDQDRPMALKLIEWESRRLQHELGGLAATPFFLSEHAETIKNPIPAVTWASNVMRFMLSINPVDMTDEIENGKYKGMSTFQKNLLRSQLPIIAQYNQFTRFSNVDEAIAYYMRYQY